MKKPAQYHDFKAKPVDNAYIDSTERSRQLKQQRTHWRKRMHEVYSLKEGYSQTIGRGDRYAGRDRLRGPYAGDVARRETSPTNRIPAQRPPQQGRVLRKATNVSEASIDRVNPTLYKDALTIAKHYRDTPRKKGGHVLDRIDRNYVGGQDIGAIHTREKKGAIPKKTFLITRGNLNPLIKQHGASVLPNHQMQRERTRGIVLPRVKKATREKRHQQTIGTAVHELLHTHDFRSSIRGDQEHAKKKPSLLKSMATAVKNNVGSKHHAKYTQDQMEKLSFDATAGVHGVRMLRKGGVSRDQAKAWLRGKDKYNTPKVKGDELNYGVKHTLFRPMRDRQRAQHTSVDAKKTYRKMAKEVNKGMDRYMPSKRRELNKGQLTLASKKPMLPEWMTEASIDHVTPRLRGAVDAAHREVQKPFWKRKAVTPKKGVAVKVKRLPKALQAGAGAAANPYMGEIFLPHRGLRKSSTTHELLHSADPGTLKDRDRMFSKPGVKPVAKVINTIGSVMGHVPKLAVKFSNATTDLSPAARAKYYGERKEKHAHMGTMGTIGLEMLKSQGVKADEVRHAQRKGKLGTFGRMSHPMTAAGEYQNLQHHSPKMKRAYRKLHKEITKGVERTYGSRNTGKRWNTYGTKMNAGPIKRLPEAITGRFADMLFEGRYQQPQQDRVQRRLTDVSECWTHFYTLDDGVNESALAAAGGKSFGGSRAASSTPVISNSSAGVTTSGRAGSVGGGFGTSGSGSGRFSGASATGGAHGGVAPAPWTGAGKGGGVGKLTSAGGSNPGAPAKNLGVINGGGTRPSGRGGSSGGAQSGGRGQRPQPTPPAAKSNAGVGGSTSVPAVGAGSKTQHNSRDLNPGNISQTQRERGANIMHNQQARNSGSGNSQRERAFQAGAGGGYRGGSRGGSSYGHQASGYSRTTGGSLSGGVNFGGGGTRGSVRGGFGSSTSRWGSQSSGWTR